MSDTAAVAAERAAELASAIKAVGIKAGGRVGIYAPNVPNWMLVIQACNRSSLQVGKPALRKTLPFLEALIVSDAVKSHWQCDGHVAERWTYIAAVCLSETLCCKSALCEAPLQCCWSVGNCH